MKIRFNSLKGEKGKKLGKPGKWGKSGKLSGWIVG